MSVRLCIAGLGFDLETRAPAHLKTLAAWAPFLGDAPVEHPLRLRFHGHLPKTATPDGQVVSDTPTRFVFERADLRLELDLAAGEAVVATQGARGGLVAAIELCLQRRLREVGGLLIHGAAVVCDGAGLLLPGRSGAGKSTAARGGGFDAILADEKVVLRRTERGFTLHGTPFWSAPRIFPLCAGEAPLTAIASLVKADRVQVAPLPAELAVPHLLSAVVLYERSAAARAEAFHLACDAVSSSRSLRLAFPKEGPWVAELRAQLAADL